MSNDCVYLILGSAGLFAIGAIGLYYIIECLEELFK